MRKSNKKTNKKAIVAAIATVSIVTVSGLFAYFTDLKTASKTVKMGKIELNVATVAADAAGTTYLPGDTVSFPATVALSGTSDDAHVRVKVEQATGGVLTFTPNTGWTDGNDGYYYYTANNGVMTKSTTAITPFSAVTIPVSTPNGAIAGSSNTITLTVEAIQAAHVTQNTSGTDKWVNADTSDVISNTLIIPFGN